MSFITSNDFKMFKVINNYFNDSTYKITTDENIMDDFKVDFINEDISIAETLVEAKSRANKAIKDHEEAFIALNRERKAGEDLLNSDDSDKDYHLAGGRYKYKYKRRYKLINKLVNVDNNNNNNYIYQLVKLN
jgi:hypothetical protein